MEILKNNTNLNIVINTEQNFRTDLGWQENLAEFEKEVLEDIINPAKNYETVRYIHKPYDVTISGITLNQSDIWFKFYFRSGATPNYVLDYNPIGITTKENELMLKQSTESFFRLEFYKTPGVISNTGTTLTCEPPTRQNRRLVNSRNLSLPLGEKYFYTGATNSSFYIHVPVFTGSNYRNRENMYLFWFDDESTLTDTNLSGTTTLDQYVFGTGSTIQTILFKNENNDITQVNIPTGGTTLVGSVGQTFTIPNQVTYSKRTDGSPIYHGKNTFFMTAKFFNGKDGDIIDFTNQALSTSHLITEEKDMYYQVDFDNYERTYQVYKYSGTTGTTVGSVVGKSTTGHTTDIEFFEKGGGIIFGTTPTPTPTPTATPTFNSSPTVTPTPVKYYLQLERCDAPSSPDPNAITGWTLNSYTNAECTYGDIFHSGGGYYYVVINSSLTNQGGNLVGSKNTSGYTSCEQTPGHYEPPVPRTAKFKALYRYSGYTSYTQIKTNMCGKDPSQFYIAGTVNKSNIYTDPSVTGSTLIPGVLYTLYEDSVDGTPIWTSSGSYWWGATVFNLNSKVDYIVRIENGIITEWRDCTTGNLIYYP